MTAPEANRNRGPVDWLCRPSLSRRIAIAMVLSLVAVQAQAFAQIRFLSDPEVRLVGVRWLSTTIAGAASELFALPPERRDGWVGREAPQLGIIEWSWSETLPSGARDDGVGPMAARLDATLRRKLGVAARGVRIEASKITYRFPTAHLRVAIVPPSLAGGLATDAVGDGEPDVLILAGIRVHVQGPDGSWLTADPIGTSDAAIGSSLPYVPLLIGGVIIALVSTFTARHMMAPLDRLVSAADRIGTSRGFVAVPTEGLNEFAAVARSFENMQRRLLLFVDERTQMLAAISHDLRSSLTRLRLLIGDEGGGSERRPIVAEIDDMEAMLVSTLAFATGEARLAPSQLTDVAALLISLVDEATDAGHACTYDGPDHVVTKAHPVSMKRALRNLIDNAIKYGGLARVRLRASEGTVHIVVEDDGPGIPPDRMEEAFAPFRRLDPARTGPGAGLGLTIARDVVLSHGGTIALDQAQSGGLAVTVTLVNSDASRAVAPRA